MTSIPPWKAAGFSLASQATIKLSKLFGSTAVNDFQISYAMNRITADSVGNESRA